VSTKPQNSQRKTQDWLTLGVETSCDETSCAVLDGKDRILSNVISSSLFRHKPFGGVVPEIASRHALEQIDTVFSEALSEAKVTPQQLELIAVTQGPGLIGSLLVGVSFAKALGYAVGIPFVGVNHLEAHLAAVFIGNKAPERFVGLLVSGGHTMLTLHEKGKVKILGATVDDAAGEAFDKVAKLLGLGYPGGPVVEREAKSGNAKAFLFTKPKQDNPYAFSFSGIKTAVLYEVRKERHGLRQGSVPGTRTQKSDLHGASGVMSETQPPLKADFVRDMSASFQTAVVGWLVEKAIKAAVDKQCSDIVIGGGVSANQYLRMQLHDAGSKNGIRIHVPEKILALDNAAMIARRGLEIFGQTRKTGAWTMTGVPDLKITAGV